MEDAPPPSVLCPPSSVLCPPSSVLSPPSVLCPPSSVLCPPSSVFRPLSSVLSPPPAPFPPSSAQMDGEQRQADDLDGQSPTDQPPFGIGFLDQASRQEEEGEEGKAEKLKS